MKKVTLFLAFISITMMMLAQNVHEANIKLGKQKLSGYTINISSANADLVDAALRERMEKNYGLKASKESGFRAYLNQPLAAFGTANYDIYYKITESGKKGSKSSLLSFIVCSGNHNAITSENSPETATAVKAFLTDLSNYVQEYSLQQQANVLQEKLDKLNKEKADLQKDMDKNNKQIEKLQKDNAEIEKKQKTNNEEIRKIESDLNAVKRSLK